jgi:hypothetical protein
MLEWLLTAALGPAAFALPVNWAADALAGAAQQWFKRLRRTDDLSRLVRAATGTSVELTRDEFRAVRQLLEDQQTWDLLGRGTVEDLAARIAERLAPGGRTGADRRDAALAIARGLLEFAVADLDPKWFQQLLFKRLERMENNEATALDNALLGLHADLAARFAGVTEQLDRVLDRLPPGPAQRSEIAVYLTALIGWLGIDRWAGEGFGGPVLRPAAIERKLHVTARGKPDLDADGLPLRYQRLVILGGPGSGKTWLAKRTARRRAESALEALAQGVDLDEIELPLYTTCSSLFAAAGGIRDAAVSSALDQLPDLGGSRICAALRAFFGERRAPTLLVLDSLDEAHGPTVRLHQAGTLSWRIVLTSRPSSWRNQLGIDENDDAQLVGSLQPLRYPGDVEPFIRQWFAAQPERAAALAAQIAGRPGLQQAATVPLILAFYCIVGGSGPLPEFRRDLYSRVLRRILTGRWHGDDVGEDHRQPDADACLAALRAWAWSGALSHPVSGVGAWPDDVATGRAGVGEADADALDHVATPLGRADDDTGLTPRRFIHRSVREHLVAEHVAGLPLDDAVGALLPHLWYDPDWEYCAPAAIAGHPEHDRLLRELIRRAGSRGQACRGQASADPSVTAVRWEFRDLLARVAAESRETDWSPEAAAVIVQARLELARAARPGRLGESAHWKTSNGETRAALLDVLAADRWEAPKLAGVVVQLDPTAEDGRRMLAAMLRVVAHRVSDWETDLGVDWIVRLAATAWERRLARSMLLGMVVREIRVSMAEKIISGAVRLAVTQDDKCEAREVLLAMLGSKRRRLDPRIMVRALAALDATHEDRGEARERLLGLLAAQPDGEVAAGLAEALGQLDPAASDKAQARERLLGLLDRETAGDAAARLAGALGGLDLAASDKAQARERLLALLAGWMGGQWAARVARAVGQLDPTAEQRREARERLLALLPGEIYDIGAEPMVAALAALSLAAEDKRETREALVALLAGRIDRWHEELAAGVAQLDPTDEDRRQAREALLALLPGETDGWTAAKMAIGITILGPTAEEQRQAHAALLALLARETENTVAGRLLNELDQLAPATEDRRETLQAILGLLASQKDAWVAAELAEGLFRFDPAQQDRRMAREALLGLLLADGTDVSRASRPLVAQIARLGPPAEEQRRVREVLLRRLVADKGTGWYAPDMRGGLAQLEPPMRDLGVLRALEDLPPELLAAARRASPLDEWLEAEPPLPG